MGIKKQIQEENKYLSDLIDIFIHKDPKRQSTVRFSASDVVGNLKLAFYRGKEAQKELYKNL